MARINCNVFLHILTDIITGVLTPVNHDSIMAKAQKESGQCILVKFKRFFPISKNKQNREIAC